MLPTSDADLTDEELDELEQFLFSESGLEAPMSLGEIDGLLTAVVIGPVFPPPSQWLPLVWGDEEGPDFASQEQAQRIIGLLMQHMNSLSRQLQQDPDAFEPMLLVDLDENKQPITIADFWCQGFMAGMNLSPDVWQDVDEILLLIDMFASEPGDAEIDDELETNQTYWMDKLGPAVAAIYKHFLATRSASRPDTISRPVARPSPTMGSEPKVGRNEICPCGSGKKYKKCCGLH